MAVSDWSTTAANNATVGGVNIADGKTWFFQLDDAIRNVMAEAKAKFDTVDATAATKASGSAFGVVKIGSGVTVNDGVISVTHPAPSIFSFVEAPASASATGTAGQIAVDDTYLYVCTATDTWKRIAWGSWT